MIVDTFAAMREAERTGSPRSVVHAERSDRDDARHCSSRHFPRVRNVATLLADRQISRGNRASRAGAELLRWSVGQWMRCVHQSSAYCTIESAKSTIALAISHDGVYFASTHGDHTVKVFWCTSWQHICTLRGHERTPWTVKFHPHSRELLASGSLDQTVRLWHTPTASCIAKHSFSYVVSCVSFHSSGEVLAVTAGKRISVWRWMPDADSINRLIECYAERAAPGSQYYTSGEGGSSSSHLAALLNAADERMSGNVPHLLARQWSLRAHEEVGVLLVGEQPQRCVAFKRAASSEMLFVAETNAESPSQLPLHLGGGEAHTAPPFTVQLRMWRIPPQLDRFLPTQCSQQKAQLRVARSVMYSDAGFDVSECGRYLALCELDPQTGYHLRTYSLQKGSVGVVVQSVALSNCPYITSVQFSPLTVAILIGYGRCQQPQGSAQDNSRYAVLRCIAFRVDAGTDGASPTARRLQRGSQQQAGHSQEQQQQTPQPPPPQTHQHGHQQHQHQHQHHHQQQQASSSEEAQAPAVSFNDDLVGDDSDDLELFSVDSTDESNVALFHPQASSSAHLAFVYATKDGRIRAFKFDPRASSEPEAA